MSSSSFALSLETALGGFLSAVILLALLLVLFWILAKICDEAIVPALEELSLKLNVPKDVACATFLALGSSAPEIVISSASTALHANDTNGAQDVSNGTIFGSACIAFTLIPALCVLVSPSGHLTLQFVPLVRDTSFYVIGVLVFVIAASFSSAGTVNLQATIVLICVFFTYLLSMRFLLRFYNHGGNHTAHHVVIPQTIVTDVEMVSGHDETVPPPPPENNHEKPLEEETNGDGDDNHSLGSETELPSNMTTAVEETITAEDEEQGTAAVRVIKPRPSFSPLKLLYLVTSYVLPPFGWKEEEDINAHWKLILFVSIIYVSLLAEACLQLTLALGYVARIPDHTLGVILIALGAQIPDTFASMAIAKQGEGPGAVSNAIGSQVMNITLGLGLPFFFSNLISGNPIRVDLSEAVPSGVSLVLTTIVFLGLACRRKFFGRYQSSSPLAGECGLSKIDAVILLCTYVIGVIVELVTSVGKYNNRMARVRRMRLL